MKQSCHSGAHLHCASQYLRCRCSITVGLLLCGSVTSETVESDRSLASQALAAAEQRTAEYEGLLEDAQLKFESVAKHRKSAQKQLDAQEEDLEHLGHRLKVFLHFLTHPITLCDKPHKFCLPA